MVGSFAASASLTLPKDEVPSDTEAHCALAERTPAAWRTVDLHVHGLSSLCGRFGAAYVGVRKQTWTTEVETMEHGRVGDRVSVESERIGQHARTGEILEVLGSGGGLHYRIRWDDGHESTFYPSAGSMRIVPKLKPVASR